MNGDTTVKKKTSRYLEFVVQAPDMEFVDRPRVEINFCRTGLTMVQKRMLILSPDIEYTPLRGPTSSGSKTKVFSVLESF